MAFRPQPTMNRDTAFFWDGLREHKLLLQRCQGCSTVRHPARPMCPLCNSLDWDTVVASGRGSVYSYVIPHHPPFPFMHDPFVVVLVELEEGWRLVANLVGVESADDVMGAAVAIEYEDFDGDLTLPAFRVVGT